MKPRRRRIAGFTVAELIVGMSLAMAVTAGVLSTYAFLGRNLARLANQQKLESEGRRALLYFTQDARLATAVSGASASGVTFTIPTTSGTTTVTYTYTYSVAAPNYSTFRRQVSGGTSVNLLTNLQTCAISYFDSTDTAVSDFTNKLNSIKRVGVSFSSRLGSAANGTLTPIHYGTSPRVILRNKPLLSF